MTDEPKVHEVASMIGKTAVRGKEKRTVQAVFTRSGNAMVELTDKRGRTVTVTMRDFNKQWSIK